MRGLGKVKFKVLQKPLDLIKKVLPKSRRQRSQEQTPAVAAAEPDGAEEGSSSSVDYHAHTHDVVEAEPLSTTTTTATVTSRASRKHNIMMLSSRLQSRSAAARSTDGVRAADPDPPEACPICQDPVGLPNPEGVVEAWTSLHCGHRFGTVCIQTWLQDTLDRDENSMPSCPICRATAKHPGCGHAVCPSSAHHLDWAQMRRQLNQGHERRRKRRRLQRRPGHPRTPSPPGREAETVGDCARCDIEARCKRLRQFEQQQHDHAPAVASGHLETQRIKSYFPVQSVRPAHGGPPESLDGTLGMDAESRHIRTYFHHTQGLTAASRSSTPGPEPEPTYASPRWGSI